MRIEEITAAAVESHASRLADEITTINALNKLLYGDDREYSRWDRFVLRWWGRFGRVRDAWLVLRGEAHIGEW